MNLQPHLTYSQEALSLSHSPVPNGGCGMPRHLRAVFVALCLVLLVWGCKKETTDESASNPPPDNTAATGAAPDAGKKAGGVLSAFSSTITVPRELRSTSFSTRPSAPRSASPARNLTPPSRAPSKWTAKSPSPKASALGDS